MHSDYGIVWSCCVLSLKSISWNCRGPCGSDDGENQARQKYKHPSKLRRQQCCLGHSHLRESWSARRLTTLLLLVFFCNHDSLYRHFQKKKGDVCTGSKVYIGRNADMRHAHETVLFASLSCAICKTTKLRACFHLGIERWSSLVEKTQFLQHTEIHKCRGRRFFLWVKRLGAGA